MKYIIFLFCIIFILPSLVVLTSQKMKGINKTNESTLTYFYKDNDYQYTFISPKENLNSISLKLKNTSIRNTSKVIFTLTGPQSEEVDLNGSNISDGDFLRFSFPQISNSKKQIFTLKLSSPDSNLMNAIAVETNPKGEPAIITYHKPASRLELIQIMGSDFITKLKNDPLFLVIWLIIMLALITFSVKTAITKPEKS